MDEPHDFFRDRFVGDSFAIRRLHVRLERAAATNAPVLIHGESGTGKTMYARALHEARPGPERPFVVLTKQLCVRDALAAAAGGTLVVDDVCNLDGETQSALLHALETLDGDNEGPRLVSITRHDPVIEMADGKFREDLYFRIFVVPVKVPPLRLRGADVIKLATHFLDQFNRLENKTFIGFDDCALYRLEDHDWPGNIRELANVVRNAIVMHEGDTISADMFDDMIGDAPPVPRLEIGDLVHERAVPLRINTAGTRQLWQIERDAIEAAIIAEDGSLSAAADRLGVSIDVLSQKRAWWKSAS